MKLFKVSTILILTSLALIAGEARSDQAGKCDNATTSVLSMRRGSSEVECTPLSDNVTSVISLYRTGSLTGIPNINRAMERGIAALVTEPQARTASLEACLLRDGSPEDFGRMISQPVCFQWLCASRFSAVPALATLAGACGQASCGDISIDVACFYQIPARVLDVGRGLIE